MDASIRRLIPYCISSFQLLGGESTKFQVPMLISASNSHCIASFHLRNYWPLHMNKTQSLKKGTKYISVEGRKCGDKTMILREGLRWITGTYSHGDKLGNV